MKASKFSEAQIAFILKQAEEGTAVAEVCRKAGISEATFYNWRKRYARPDAVGGEAAAPARGRERQAEEARRRPVPGQGHAAGRPVKKALKPARRRQLVDEVRESWKVSIRRACRALRIDRSLYHYKSEARRSGRSEAADQGDLRDAGALRLPACPCSAATGGMGDQREANLQALQ